jgi:putative nucleotidyltransferase with HDIG domain
MEVPEKKNILPLILSMIDNLPPMPENIVKLRKICADSNSSFKDLVPIIEKDPGFCADILHIANSAFYGIKHKVESVREAVRYIGFNSVVDFVSISFSNTIVRGHFSGIGNLDEYFTHSNNVAIATKYLAQVAGKTPEDQEFYSIAGLLHDIGRLVILTVSDHDVRSLIDDMSDHHLELIQREYDIFGIDHCLIGKQICEKWHFSEELQMAVLRHHTPLKEPFAETAAFILLAHFIAMRDFPINQVLSLYPPEITALLRLRADNIIKARQLFLGNPE